MTWQRAWIGVLFLAALGGRGYAQQTDCEAVVAEKSLCAQLRDHDPAKRSAALRALAATQSRRGEAAALVIQALWDPSTEVRASAASSLVALGADGLRALLPDLVDKCSTWVRITLYGFRADAEDCNRTAIEFLDQHGSEYGAALCELLDDPDMAAPAAWAIGRSRATICVPRLLAAIDGEDEDLAAEATYALRIASSPEAINRLIALSASESHTVADGALQALEEMGAPAVPFLLDHLREDDPWRRILMVTALARATESRRRELSDARQQAARALLPMLDGRDPDLRLGAMDALRGLGADAASATQLLVDSLEEGARLLEKGDARLDSAAHSALVAIGRDAVVALRPLLHDGSAVRRRLAVEVIGWMADDDAYTLLLSMAGDADAGVRERVMARLRWGPPHRTANPLPILIRAMEHDPEPKVRAAAAKTLGGHDRRAMVAVPSLLKRLSRDPSPDVRAAAAEASGRIGGNQPRIRAAFKKALRDPEAPVRLAVIGALCLPPFSAVERNPLLIPALNDPVSDVRMTAASCLRDGDDAPAALRPLLLGPDNDLAIAAAETLSRMEHGAEALIEGIRAAASDRASQLESSLARCQDVVAMARHLDDSDAAVRSAVSSALLDHLKDENTRGYQIAGTCIAAVNASADDNGLGCQPYAEALPIIRAKATALLTDEDPGIRERAAAILETIGAPSAK